MPSTASGIVYPSSLDRVDVASDMANLANSIEPILAAIPRKRVKYKPVGETRTSTTVLANDADLFTDLAPGLWEVDAYLHALGGPGDVDIAWTFSGTAPLVTRSCMGPGLATADLTNGTVNLTARAIGTVIAYGCFTTTPTNVIHENLFLSVSTLGTLNLQWAQDSSSATASTLGSASRIYITQLTAAS